MTDQATADTTYLLTDEQVAFREVVRQIARERVAPRAAEIDEKAEYPHDLRQLLAEQDILALPFEEEHGGTGTGTLTLNIAVEELAKACASTALMLMVQELGSLPIKPGVSVGKPEHKMGIRGSPTGQPVFTDVLVPAENLIGEEGQGFRVAMSTLDRSRLGVAAQGLGIAQGATDYAAAYAKERRQVGKPIIGFQGSQFKLADTETQCAAGRELLYKACAKVDSGAPDPG